MNGLSGLDVEQLNCHFVFEVGYAFHKKSALQSNKNPKHHSKSGKFNLISKTTAITLN